MPCGKASWRCRMGTVRHTRPRTESALINGPHVNLFAESGNRDPVADTPYHKNLAICLALVPELEAAAYQSQSERIHMRAAGQ